MPDTPPSNDDHIARLLRMALEDDADTERTLQFGAAARPRSATESTRRWQPPSVEQLQQALPQYEISALIARGGMGAVYKGMQRTLKRSVAIKVLPPEIEDRDMKYAARFKHEAQAMARLSHPNIVAVFDAGETADGLLYFVMEFIEGTDVAQLIASQGALEAKRAVEITVAVCGALAFAHEEGIIHRDIKPSNVMIDKKGRVKVADFGLAKTVNVESTYLTGTNVTMGTPDFMAPEAMIAGTLVDQRADLYAVGVMLYQMLTGKIPRGRFAMPSGVSPQVDPRLDLIVDRAMQTEREDRYSTAQEMKEEVERVVQGSAKVEGAQTVSIIVPPPPPSEVTVAADTSAADRSVRAPLAPAKPIRARLLAATAALIAIGTGVYFIAKPHPKPNLAEQKSANASASFPASARWMDVTDQVRAEGLRQEKVKADGAWIEAVGASPGYIDFGPRGLTDAAVRVTFSHRISISLRLVGERSSYVAECAGGGARLFLRDPVNPSSVTTLSEVSLNQDLYKDDAPHEAVFAATGSQLRFWIDGQLVASAADSRYPIGRLQLTTVADGKAPPTRIQKVEWAAAVPPTAQWLASDFDTLTTHQVVGGRLHLSSNGALIPDKTVRPQNAATRASLVWQADTGDVKLSTRYLASSESSQPTTAWFARFTANDVSIGTTNGTDSTVRNIPLEPPIRTGDKVTLEFASIGHRHLVWVNEKLAGEVTDERLSQKGQLRLSSGEGLFDSFEYLPLDGLPEGEALKLVGLDTSNVSSSPSPQVSKFPSANPQWHDALAEAPLKNVIAKADHSAQGYLLPVGNHWRFPAQPLHHGALRVRATATPGRLVQLCLYLGGPDDSHYRARFERKTQQCILSYVPKPTADKDLATKKVMPADDQPYDLLLARVGGQLWVALNGQVIMQAAEPDASPGQFGIDCVQGSASNVRILKVEYLNLDGLPEAEALKLAAETPTPATSIAIASAPPPSVPSPKLSPDGENVYSPGVWTRMWTPDQEAHVEQRDGEWMMRKDISAGVGTSGRPHLPNFTNAGLRVRFRGKRIKEDFIPQINLQSSAAGSWNLNVNSSDELQIRKARPGAGFPVLAEITLQRGLRNPSREYVMEFYAIGRTLIGRIDGETVTARMDEEPAAGTCGIYGANNDFFRDMHFINLDGVPEAEALKLAGIAPPPTANHEPQTTNSAAPAPQWQPAYGRPLKELATADGSRTFSDGWLTLRGSLHPAEIDASRGTARLRLGWLEQSEILKLGLATTNIELRVTPSGAALLQTTHGLEPNPPRLNFATPLAPGAEKNLRIAWLDGRVYGWVDDQFVGTQPMLPDKNKVTGVWFANDKKDQQGRLRDFEILNLDGLPEAEALKLVGPAAESEKWSDVLGDLLRLSRDNVDVTPQGAQFKGRGSLQMREMLRRDAALRIRTTFDPRYCDLHLRGRASTGGQQYYKLKVSDDRTVKLEGVGSGGMTLISSFPLAPPLAKGQEYQLELRCVGTHLTAKLDGKVIGEVDDAAYSEGRLVVANGDNIRTLVKSIEFLDLSSGSETVAPSQQPGALGAPYPTVSPDGEKIYPPGAWTRMWSPDQEAYVEQRDGEWMMRKDISASVGTSGRPHLPNFTNAGLRVRFRGQRSIKDDLFPQINLQSSAAGSLNLYVDPSGSKLLIRKPRTGAGFPVLAEINLQRKLREPSREYVMEFYAIGRTLIGRIDGETVTAQLDEAPVAGTCGIYGTNSDFFRDMHFINLDGVPEAEALKLAGAPAGEATPYPVGQWVDAWPLMKGFADRAGSPTKGYQERGGWVEPLANAFTVSDPRLAGRNLAIRATLRFAHDANHFGQVMVQREVMPDRKDRSYRIRLKYDYTATRLLLRDAIAAQDSVNEVTLAESPLPKPLAAGDAYTLQLAMVGRHLIAWCNGQKIGEVTDARMAAGDAGIVTGEAFRDFQVMNLDGLPEAEALKLAGVSSSQEQAAPPAWQRIDFAPLDNAFVAGKHKNASKEGDLILLRQEDTWPAGESQTMKNGAVRATFVLGPSSGGERVVTRLENGRQYQARLWPDNISFGEYGGTRAHHVRELKKFPIPGGLKPGAEVTLQLASIGAHHFVWWNGQLLGSVDDGSITDAGVLAIQATNGRFKSMEWLPLDGLPEAEALNLVGVGSASAPKSTAIHATTGALTFAGHRYQFVPGR